MTSVDEEAVSEAYQQVRDNSTGLNWLVLKYEGTQIVCTATGADFDEFKEQFRDDERAYGFLRLQAGDETSRQARFALVVWLGPEVSVLKKARMSTDKALVKNVLQNFSLELLAESQEELDLDSILNQVMKVTGTTHGNGK